MVVIDASTVPFWFNILIYIQLYFSQYWYILFPAMGSAIPFGIVKTFAFPLLTRNPAELIIMFSPTRARVIRVSSRVLPWFTYRNNLYWFAEPVTVGHNLYHIYIEGVNQPLTALDRNQEKEINLLSLREYTKQTTAHNIIIPPSRKSFIRNWVLIVGNGTAELKTQKEAMLKGKLRYKIGVLKRIGLFMLQEQQVEQSNASSTANQQLVTVTMQMIEQKVGNVVKGTNFSSRFAFKILKRARWLEISWIRLLTGEFDFRIILILVGVIGAFAAIYFLFGQ